MNPPSHESDAMRYVGRYDGKRVLIQNLNQAILGTVDHYYGGFMYFREVEAFYAPCDQKGTYCPPSTTVYPRHGQTPVFQVRYPRCSDIATGDTIDSALASLSVSLI